MPQAEAHEVSEVEQNMAILRNAAPTVAASMNKTIRAVRVAHDVPVPPVAKKIHFIRHGEGHHNVAQREWRANPAWNGMSEPYTIDNDPTHRYVDAELTAKGEAEARALQEITEPALKPEVMIVSPMRRATLTGLLAFEPHIKRGELPVVANELCHERGGRHTCDKRLAKSTLQQQYPNIDYTLVAEEEDPFWLDGWTREPWTEVCQR